MQDLNIATNDICIAPRLASLALKSIDGLMKKKHAQKRGAGGAVGAMPPNPLSLKTWGGGGGRIKGPGPAAPPLHPIMINSIQLSHFQPLFATIIGPAWPIFGWWQPFHARFSGYWFSCLKQHYCNPLELISIQNQTQVHILTEISFHAMVSRHGRFHAEKQPVQLMLRRFSAFSPQIFHDIYSDVSIQGGP